MQARNREGRRDAQAPTSLHPLRRGDAECPQHQGLLLRRLRKKASRGGIEQQAESRWIVECLRRMRLVAKIWPVYSWDESPPIFALMVTPQSALGELNAFGIPLTEGELERALRDCSAETSNAADRLKTEVKALYNARKDRRIKIGDRPPLHDTLTGGRPPGR